MEKEMILSPEELYYLGSVLQARYIDYAYIAAMDDIGHNYSLFEKEAKTALVRKGVLTEDFGGNTEMDADAAAILSPIFFGEVETSIDVCTLGEESAVQIYKFHFCDGAVTMVTGENGKLILRSVDQTSIREIVEQLVPEAYACDEVKTVSEIAPDTVTRFIAVKSIRIRKTAVVKTYIEADGILYRETGEDRIESVTRDMFISDVYETVQGV